MHAFWFQCMILRSGKGSKSWEIPRRIDHSTAEMWKGWFEGTECKSSKISSTWNLEKIWKTGQKERPTWSRVVWPIRPTYLRQSKPMDRKYSLHPHLVQEKRNLKYHFQRSLKKDFPSLKQYFHTTNMSPPLNINVNLYLMNSMKYFTFSAAGHSSIVKKICSNVL